MKKKSKSQSKKIFSSFYTNHRDWFITMTASFVATVLGIMVTLGASAYQRRAEHKKQTELFMRDVVLDMSYREDNMRKDSVKFAQIESALMTLDATNDEHASLFKDTIVFQHIGWTAYFSFSISENKLIENLFSTNEAAFQLIDDYESTQTIRTFYGAHSVYNTHRKELADVSMRLLPEIIVMVSLQMPNVEIMRKADHMASYYEWMQRVANTIRLIDYWLPQMHQQRLSIMETMGVTEEDIESWKK